jgi:hypothetical protein
MEHGISSRRRLDGHRWMAQTPSIVAVSASSMALVYICDQIMKIENIG